MADNDQNDEYKFDDLDSYSDSSETPEEFGLEKHSPQKETSKFPQKDIRRNALIAVGGIVGIMMLYKLVGGIFSGRSTTDSAKQALPPSPAPITAVAPSVQQPVAFPKVQEQAQSVPTQPVQQQAVTAQEQAVLQQKIDSLEGGQQTLQSQISSVNEQINTVNNNVNNLSEQVNKLNQTLVDLTSQLNRQSEVITILRMQKQKVHIRKPRQSIRSSMRQGNIYYINAVIPGRAWLIASNGSTLTVREGTKIAGYGAVKLIDSMEGRVLTSSGRVIRFSQDDS